MRRGMSEIKSVIDENRRSQQSGGFMRYFKLEDGETTTVLFMDPTEPAYVKEHNFKNGKSFKAIQHREENCVCCHVSSGGDRRVGRAAEKACFSLFDLSWRRKTKNEEKTKEAGQDRFDYERVEEDDVTPKGIARGLFVRGGKCGWKMSTQWMQAINAINIASGRRCKNCNGKLKRIGYERKDGAKFLASKYEDHQIEGLLQGGKILEKLECAGCDSPERKTIFNSIVQITRAGKDTNTTYQFEVVPDDLPEDVVTALEAEDGPKPFDWEEMFPEPSTDAQAMDLGVRNPFPSSGKAGKSSKAASSYDEDDEEDDDEDDYTEDPFAADDDDEDEKPAKKKTAVKKVATETPVKKVAAKKKIVEEDDEGDEDEDEEDDEEEAPKKRVVTKKLVKKTPMKTQPVKLKLKFGSR